jgi:hypothetical protein
MKRIVHLLALLVCMQGAWAHPLWSAATMPASGHIAGEAGTTIGWGYQIGNEDTARWLVLSGISADVFEHASPLALFDLPILAPGASVAQAFDGVHGLYGLSWDSDTPDNFVNTGMFVLTAQWWDGDPLGGGALAGDAESLNLPYSALAAPAQPVPEPGAPLLMAAGMAALLTARRYRRRCV